MERSAETRESALPTILLLGGLVLVALALRLPSLPDSLYGDEISTNFIVHGFGVDDVVSLVAGDQEASPPLFFLVTWLTKGLGGVESLRLPSLLAGLAAVPLTYLLGLRTVGRTAGAVGAALIALSPFLIFYSTEARNYGLLLLLTLLSTLALLKALESGGVWWWSAYALLITAAMYTHYTCLFLLLAQFAWAFVAKPRARVPLLAASLAGAVLYLPWLPELIEDRNNPTVRAIEILHPLTFDSTVTDVLHWSLGHPFVATASLPGALGLWLIGAGLLAGALGCALRALGRWGGLGQPTAEQLLVPVLALATPVGVILASIPGDSLLLSRNLTASSPGLALAAGALVVAARGPLRVAAIALLLGGFTVGAVKMTEANFQRPDYLGAAEFIAETGEPDSPVVEVTGLTPGPQTLMEVALAEGGEPAPKDRELIQLGYPEIEQRLRVAAPGPPGITDPLPLPSDADVASRAAQAAGTGPIFLVLPYGLTVEQLSAPGSPAAGFLADLPPRFHVVESRNFRGLDTVPLAVFVLDGS